MNLFEYRFLKEGGRNQFCQIQWESKKNMSYYVNELSCFILIFFYALIIL